MRNVRPPSAFAALTARFRLDLEWILLAGLLAGLLLLGALVIVRFKRWQAAQQETALPRVEDYQALMEQGLLDPLEFERIRERLNKKEAPDPPRPPSPPIDPDVK